MRQHFFKGIATSLLKATTQAHRDSNLWPTHKSSLQCGYLFLLFMSTLVLSFDCWWTWLPLFYTCWPSICFACIHFLCGQCMHIVHVLMHVLWAPAVSDTMHASVDGQHISDTIDIHYNKWFFQRHVERTSTEEVIFRHNSSIQASLNMHQHPKLNAYQVCMCPCKPLLIVAVESNCLTISNLLKHCTAKWGSLC